MAWGDAEGDGDLDLAVGSGGENKVYLNQGGALQTTAAWTSGDTDHTLSVAWGDVDGDGDLDLAAGNNSEGRNKIYLNRGEALRTLATWTSSGTDGTSRSASRAAPASGMHDLAVGSLGIPFMRSSWNPALGPGEARLRGRRPIGWGRGRPWLTAAARARRGPGCAG